MISYVINRGFILNVVKKTIFHTCKSIFVE